MKILDNELAEQFCSDGGHYELSPMYHQILMWDICDLINLAQSSGNKYLQSRVESWSKILLKADSWRKAMYHPNGELAFFNDCAFGVAPPNSVIDAYLKKFNVSQSPRLSNIGTYRKQDFWSLLFKIMEN